MQFAFSTKILRLQPLFEAIDFVAKAGFRAVEIMADRPHAFPEDLTAPKVQSLNQFLQERRLKVSNLYSSTVATLEDTHNPSWIEEDWKKRELRMRYTLDSATPTRSRNASSSTPCHALTFGVGLPARAST